MIRLGDIGGILGLIRFECLSGKIIEQTDSDHILNGLNKVKQIKSNSSCSLKIYRIKLAQLLFY